MKRILPTFIVAILLATQTTTAYACPMCKYALETSDSEPMAYMISILFMMGTISTLFFAVAGLLWWITKQEKKNLTAAGYEHLFENAGSQPYLAKPSAQR